jgi:guanine deaminase
VRVRCEHLLLATGSEPVELPMLPFGGAVVSSTGALAPESLPRRLVVVGAGYIGLELGMAYRKLGVEVAVVEAAERVLPGYDEELTQPVLDALEKSGVVLHLGCSVQGYDAQHGVRVRSARADEFALPADRVLVAVGRKPRTTGFGLESLQLDMAGRYVAVDAQCRTSMRNVWAIGDITGDPMLAHRAMAQGEVVAEVIAGKHRRFEPMAIPAVCFTDPEVVVVGKTPGEARAAGLDCIDAAFPFAANGRAMTLEATGGFVRVVARKDNHLILGWQAVGQGVAELAAAFTQSIEMGARLEDVAGTIHAHPTLGEAVQEAALRALGHAVAHLTPPRMEGLPPESPSAPSPLSASLRCAEGGRHRCCGAALARWPWSGPRQCRPALAVLAPHHTTEGLCRRKGAAGSGKLAAMHIYRSALLRFSEDGQALYDEDGLLAIGPDAQGRQRVLAVGAWQQLAPQFAGQHVTHWPGRLIAPGFVDMHVHYPQTDVIGSPAEGLLPWLENYTFPHEKRFVAQGYAAQVAEFFLDELLRNGVTTALAFATSHPQSVDALFTEARRRQLRLMTGKVLQDRHSPDGVRDETEQSLIDTEDLITRWHGVDRLGYAITPRFAPTSSPAQLRGAGQLAARYPDVWIQSHVAENLDEVRWACELYPRSRSYLAVYDDFGLMRERAVYAHCIHFDAADRALMHQRRTAAAVSPTSNLFLGSGFFDYQAADRAGFAYGLASDVGGGTSFSPFRTMLAAYTVGREGQTKPGLSLSPQQLWWQHTAGAARALGLDGVVGNLQPGCEGDFVVLNPQATPLLARRTAQASSLDELLFSMIVLGDDRLVEQTVISQAKYGPGA